MIETVTLESCRVLVSTEKGVGVEYEGDQMWIPNSVIESAIGEATDNEPVDIVVPAWWAHQEGLL